MNNSLLPASAVNIYALGGLQEVGKNTYCIENDDTLIIIDAGIMFPEQGVLGIDYVIPDYTHLKNVRNKIKALFITHGHEDHIGAIPYLLQNVNIPVIYAPRLACALIKNKLDENRMSNKTKVVEYTEDDVINIDTFTLQFFRVTHSIPDAYGICVDTPQGRIITTGELVSGKAISSITINGKPVDNYELTIYGDEAALDSIKYIPINIDVKGQGNNGSKKANVTIDKPAGVRALSESNVSVELNFDEAKQKTIVLQPLALSTKPNI